MASAAAIAAQVSEVLSYAHGQGVVHRDLKPANLMLTPAGTVKVLDFGIAAALEPDPGEPVLTRAGVALGTLGFIAPERLRGQRATPLSDLYEFGCVLYQLLAGQPPFSSEVPEELPYLHLNHEPPRLDTRRPGIPKEFADLVDRLLAKAPEQRPATAEEIFAVAAPLVGGAEELAVRGPAGTAEGEYDPTLYYTRRSLAPASVRRPASSPPPGRKPPAAPPGRAPQTPLTPPRPEPAAARASGPDDRAEAHRLAERGRYSQAADLLAHVLDEAARPLTDPELVGDRLSLLRYYRKAGELQRAYDGYFTLGAALRPTRPPADRDVLECWVGTAACLHELGRTAEALIEYEGLLPYQRQALGVRAPEVFDTRYQIAVLHAGAGDVGLAHTELLQLKADQRTVLPAGHPALRRVEALIDRLERLVDR